MGQMQRHQEAKGEMNLQEKHLLQAQLLFAQHAAARAAGSKIDSALFGKADGQAYQAVQRALDNHFSRIDPDDEYEDSDEEEQEMVENEGMEDDEEDEAEEEIGLYQPTKKPRLQQVPGFPFPAYSMSQPSGMKQMSRSPPSEIKQEHEEKDQLSPAGQKAFTSPNGFSDWGCDEPFKQVGYGRLHCLLCCMVYGTW